MRVAGWLGRNVNKKGGGIGFFNLRFDFKLGLKLFGFYLPVIESYFVMCVVLAVGFEGKFGVFLCFW